MATAKRRRRTQAEEYVSYVLRVSGWDCHYWLHGSDPKSRWEPGPYSELCTLTFLGDVIRPEKSKFEVGKVTLSAKAGMLQEAATQARRPIGSLRSDGKELDTYVFVPADQMAGLMALAGSGRVQLVRIGATKLRYRSATVYSVSLDTSFIEDEL